MRGVQFVYVHSFLWDTDTYSTALKTTGNYFPTLRVFAGKAKFWASPCRQNSPSQLAPMPLSFLSLLSLNFVLPSFFFTLYLCFYGCCLVFRFFVLFAFWLNYLVNNRECPNCQAFSLMMLFRQAYISEFMLVKVDSERKACIISSFV